MNLFRVGQRLVIIDFAHNEAGTQAILEVAAGLADGAPVTAIIGTAGDRPDDTLRGIGRIAAERADRLAIKETPAYLRGRDRVGLVALIRDGIREGGRDPESVPVYAARHRRSMPRSTRPATRASSCCSATPSAMPCSHSSTAEARGRSRRAHRRRDRRDPLTDVHRSRSGSAHRPDGGRAASHRRTGAWAGRQPSGASSSPGPERGRALRPPGEGHRLPIHDHGVVRAHDHEVARRGPPERDLHRRGLVEHLLDPRRAAAALASGRAHAGGHVGRGLAGRASAQVPVLADQTSSNAVAARAPYSRWSSSPGRPDPDHPDRPPRAHRVRCGPGPRASTPGRVCGSTIIRLTKSASWRIPSTLWQ